MPEERVTRKEKISDAREERKMKTLTDIQESTFSRRLWQITGAATIFMLVSSVSLGLGIGLGTGNLTGGANNTSNSANGGNSGNDNSPPPSSQEPGEPAAAAVKGEQSNPANAATDGFIFTSTGKIIAADPVDTAQPSVDNPDVVDLKVFIDYSCGFCKQFEQSEGENLARALDDPKINISYHILAFLGPYSQAAGNASACVASLEPEKWDATNLALFNGVDGGSGSESLELAGGYVANLLSPVGLGEDTYSCINELRHVDWLDQATNRAFDAPQTPEGAVISGTPAVVADSELYNGEDFAGIGNLTGILNKHLALLGN
jgi:hypothetical protein